MKGRLLAAGVSIVFFTVLFLSLTSAFNSSSSIGYLVIKIKDPPEGWGSASALYITSDDINIHRADMGNESGWYKTGVSVTNLSLGELTIFERIVGQTSLPAGLYNIIRFEIVKAIVTVDGKNYSSEVASGKLNVPIISGGVRIVPNHSSSLLIDITPKITGKDGRFKLTPSVKATPA